jgi:hypothetical protein
MPQSRQAIYREIQASQGFKHFSKSVGVSLIFLRSMASARRY